jgi:hypothetical protein
MIAKTFTPESGAKSFVIMVWTYKHPGGKHAGGARVADGELAASGSALEGVRANGLGSPERGRALRLSVRWTGREVEGRV